MSAITKSLSPTWHLFIPKAVIALRQGYSFAFLRSDLTAGLTVAIVALPLAMALAIASGTTPDRGLFTAIVAGFLISCLGGSRYQIGGPTGAFVVVVFNVIQHHGYEGLVIATMMAGVILILFGLARLGTIIKYIPYPVITGFTAGIGVIIFSSQIKDLIGLPITHVPADFVAKYISYMEHLSHWSPIAAGVSIFTLALMIGLRYWKPTLPHFLIAIVVSSLLVWFFNVPVDTIGSRFGSIPHGLPQPTLPSFSWEVIVKLIPSAFTIAFLAGIESLLSAVIADSMTGGRHRSNCELISQGIANIASVIFGGIPATGALARTAANIKSGAKTPVAGMAHALSLFLFMWLLAPLASWIPLGALAAILVIIAWNMSEIGHIRYLLKAPKSDRAILLTTFLLTILVDLTVAIEVGMIMALLVFTWRMIEISEARLRTDLVQSDEDELSIHFKDKELKRSQIPEGVEIVQINGPFFFGVASLLNDTLDKIMVPPKVFIVHMRNVPFIDATGAHALRNFVDKLRQQRIEVILSGVNANLRRILLKMSFQQRINYGYMADNLKEALALVKELRNPA